MIRAQNSRFGKCMYTLFPGDHFATREDCVLGTVTGMTVCVCVYDDGMKIGGMGHFIVPGMMGTEGIVADEIAAQGITSMEHLIGEIVKLGGDRKYLKAKLFGAGYLKTASGQMEGITLSNIRFLNEYFAFEKIKVEKEDLGGQFRRQIIFNPGNGVAFRRFQRRNEDASEFIRLEQEYIDNVFRNKQRYGKVYIFE